MTMTVLRNRATGASCVVEAGAPGYDDPAVWELLPDVQPHPDDGIPYELDAAHQAFVPAPRHLDAYGVLALYTATERARIFNSSVAQVLQMLIAILYFGVSVGSTEHVQGTALVASLGLLDGQRDAGGTIVNQAPGRVARIVAGELPA